MRTLLKRTSALYDVLVVVHNEGLESVKLRETFDLACTSLNLEPKGTVNWPPRLIVARYRATIQAVPANQVDLWAKMMSSEELRKHGIVEVKAEQIRLLGSFKLISNHYADYGL